MIEKGGVKAALAAGILVTAGMTPGVPHSPEVSSRLSASEVQAQGNKAQDVLQNYWRSQGVGMRATFQVVGERSWATCESKAILGDDPDGAFYCDKGNKIVLTKAADELLDTQAASQGVPAEATLALIIAHETGHEVQDRTTKDGSANQGKPFELQADCLAGQAIAASMPAIIRFGPAFYLSLRPINYVRLHGTTEERTQRFQQGVAGQTC